MVQVFYMARGTFPDFRLGTEVEIRKEGRKTADAY